MDNTKKYIDMLRKANLKKEIEIEIGRASCRERV